MPWERPFLGPHRVSIQSLVCALPTLFVFVLVTFLLGWFVGADRGLCDGLSGIWKELWIFEGLSTVTKRGQQLQEENFATRLQDGVLDI